MQDILPVAIRGSLPDNVSLVLYELCHFFKELCSKVLNMHDLEKLQARVALTLCHMERIFPPSFFTSQVHLIIHLAAEAKVAGPVQYRWMYPIERYLYTLKSYVRNRSSPEGSIAEGYLADECLTFCSRYLSRMETKFNRPIRNDHANLSSEQGSSIFSLCGRALGHKCKQDSKIKKRTRFKEILLEEKTWVQAHRYVLFNYDVIKSFRREHEATISRKNRRLSRRPSQNEIAAIHSRTFHEWFHDYVARLDEEGDARITNEIRWLAHGPRKVARRYNGFIVNGFRFHTKEHERNLTTQNSGVVVSADIMSYANVKDKRPIEGKVTYYGVLRDIIELNYHGKYKVVLFKCDWVDVDGGRGYRKDKFGSVLVNFSYLIHTGANLTDDPFILAIQAKKVFYVKDQLNEGWHVVLHARVRDLFDMGDEFVEGEQSNESVLENDVFGTTQEDTRWTRDDIDANDEDEIQET